MSHKTNKKRTRRNKHSIRKRHSRRNTYSRRNSYSIRNDFIKRSRINRKNCGGKYNDEQIQQIIAAIKSNNVFIGITDEEITQFINNINPTSAVFANVRIVGEQRLHPRFPELIRALENFEPNLGQTGRASLQILGQNLSRSNRADYSDVESDEDN